MKHILKYSFYLCLIFGLTSCDIDDDLNPNGPSITGVFDNATKSQLQTLVTGTEDLLRQDLGFYYDVTSIVGRDYYFFTGSDPRYTGELLGKGDSQLDNAGFYHTRPYQGRYRTIKNLNVLNDAVDGTNLISEAEAKGYKGFAKTLQAYEYLLALNLQYENGIRTDVNDPNNLGPFVSYSEGLSFIQNLLDEGMSDLSGSEFSFSLSEAMADFATPAAFAQFNRGLSARVALYQGNHVDALSSLGGSFMDMSGDLYLGPKRFYSTAGGDFTNNLFRPTNQADGIIAHPSFTTDIVAGDTRINKVAQREATLTLDGLSGDYDVVIYKSLNDFVPLMRNEELILIAAESRLMTGDVAGAVDAINVIRSAHGLANYAGSMAQADLMNEILYNRRYSLFGEGHRWVDHRRLGRLNELPIDRDGDDVYAQFPRPVSENI